MEKKKVGRDKGFLILYLIKKVITRADHTRGINRKDRIEVTMCMCVYV